MNTIKAKDVSEKKAKVFVSFVLDESSSMSTGQGAIVSGMNEQIQTLKKRFADGSVEPVVTFVKFSDNVISMYEGRTLDELQEFKQTDYKPNGMTALYDAVGYTIDTVQKLDGINDEGNSSLLIIITDGEENSSRKFNSSQISEKIKTLNGSGKWTLTYIGPNNVDLTVVNKSTNINYGNMYSVNLNDSFGYTKAFTVLGSSVETFYSGIHSAAISGCSYVSDAFYGDISSGGQSTISLTDSATTNIGGSAYSSILTDSATGIGTTSLTVDGNIPSIDVQPSGKKDKKLKSLA